MPIQIVNNTADNAQRLAANVLATGAVPVFDLDGVLLDARHRQVTKADGSLDLDHYRENSTAELIAQDKPLPLIEAIQRLNMANHAYYVCTARSMSRHDYELLASLNIKPRKVFSRDGVTDNRRDFELKTAKLSEAFNGLERMNMLLIDDNLANCKAAESLGMLALRVPFDGH